MPTEPSQADPPKRKRRWFHVTPDRLIIGLLALEGFLVCSEQFRWFPFFNSKGWTVLFVLASVGITILILLLWLSFALVFRQKFQFRLRSLLGLVLALAIPSNWLAVEMRQARRQRDSAEAIRKVGGQTLYDYQLAVPPGTIFPSEPPGPASLRKILGDDFFTNVIDAIIGTDAGLERVQGLRQLKSLTIGALRPVQVGSRTGSQLSTCNVADASLDHLVALNQLEKLHLMSNNVTDAGLERMQGLSSLRQLYLGSNRVTDQGVAKLRLALPNCKIGYERER